MMTHQAVSRVTKTPFWHLLGTFQTPSNLPMFALWRASVGKTVLEYDYKNDFCQLLFLQYSLGNIQDQSDSIQKPSIHPPDTIHQSPWCLGHILESLKKHPNRLDRVPNSLVDAYEVIALCLGVSGGFLGGVWLILDVAKTVLIE